ncbi:homeodomain-only protein [Mixophyes fleayi]|uniref:homeodomain-only protein n=1 Tax=Mixophyes fleayi TaxID=3061075 RepID=UPI003F4DB470
MTSLQTETCENEEKNLTQDQIEVLEYNFKLCKQPDWTTLMLIAIETGLTEQETVKWFRFRLSKWRRSEGLPSECGSVMD